jgi:hypothetical protein
MEVKKCSYCGTIINIPFGLVNGKYVCSRVCFDKQRAADAKAVFDALNAKKKKPKKETKEDGIVKVAVEEVNEPEVVEENVTTEEDATVLENQTVEEVVEETVEPKVEPKTESEPAAKPKTQAKKKSQPRKKAAE